MKKSCTKKTPPLELDPIQNTLSGSLEDYLETIYCLVQKQQFARVKDICKARNVKAGSVTPALKKLSYMDLINYAQREYVTLTPEGEIQARRVFYKHKILKRFFDEILQIPPEIADDLACGIEHRLSAKGMDHLVRFFEFLAVCPKAPAGFLQMFKQCPIVADATVHCHANLGDQSHCKINCNLDKQSKEQQTHPNSPLKKHTLTVANLLPGQHAKIGRIVAPDKIRQRLFDLGLFPNVSFSLERVDQNKEAIWIKIDNAILKLRVGEAKAIRVLNV